MASREDRLREAVQLVREQGLTTRQAAAQKDLSQSAVSRALRNVHGGNRGRRPQFTKFEEEFIFRFLLKAYKEKGQLTHKFAIHLINTHYVHKSRKEQERILREEFEDDTITARDVGGPTWNGKPRKPTRFWLIEFVKRPEFSELREIFPKKV
jgi:predicted transcriptional regulator